VWSRFFTGQIPFCYFTVISIIPLKTVKEKYFSGKKCVVNLTGDGAGVGKGRTIAGIIYENYLHGRKRSLW